MEHIIISGISTILPTINNNISSTLDDLISGTNFIKPISEELKNKIFEKNIIKLKKDNNGSIYKSLVTKDTEHLSLYASIDNFNIDKYELNKSIVDSMDKGVQIAVACGLDAIKNSGIYSNNNPNDWILPLELQNTTGIIYVTAFPALETAIHEVTKYFNTKLISNLDVKTILEELKNRLEKKNGEISSPINSIFEQIEDLCCGLDEDLNTYEFDRRFIFKILLLANSQLAQIIKAKGPNLQTNTACTGTTQAISIACDMIQSNKVDRMIVIASDIASSDTLMPWIGNVFNIIGTTCVKTNINDACIPFNEKRSGLLISAGAVALVVEKKSSAKDRCSMIGVKDDNNMQCHILGTLISNSASHGTSMNLNHIAQEFERFITTMENKYNITRQDIAKHGVYLSHETSTNASVSTSCAYNELCALKHVFGEELQHILILNTKGFTGHAMSVSFEDIVAVDIIINNNVPPIANYTEIDPKMGLSDLKMSGGGKYKCKYALKFSAGFGSQIAFILYGKL